MKLARRYFRRLKRSRPDIVDIAERCRNLGMTCVLENKLAHLLFGDVRDIIWILEALKGADVEACASTLAMRIWPVTCGMSRKSSATI